MTLSIIDNNSLERERQALSDYLPDDILFEAKNILDSNLYKFLNAIANTYKRFDDNLNQLACEFDPTQADYLLEKWETFLGIPDDCIPLETDITKRREFIILKLAMMNVKNVDDFISLAKTLGYNITIELGSDSSGFDYTFPFRLFDSSKQARFTIFINLGTTPLNNGFDYTFDFFFAEDNTNLLKCILEKVKPANVDIIYESDAVLISQDFNTSDFDANDFT